MVQLFTRVIMNLSYEPLIIARSGVVHTKQWFIAWEYLHVIVS